MNPDSMISRMMNRVETFVFYHPKIFLSAIVLITIFFASRVPYVQMYSDFADLLPLPLTMQCVLHALGGFPF